MAGTTRSRRITPSTIAAVVMVLAAGCITWYGLDRSSSSGPPHVAAATMPGSAAADDASPAGAPAMWGNLPTRIVIPSAGIDAPVAEVGVVFDGGKAVWETAWKAAGHHIDSARPGQPGNVVITGHVSVADRGNLAVFRTLDKVNPGDIIEVQTGDTTYRYQVNGVTVESPDATRVLRSDHTARITLITCTHDLKHRLIVTGTLV